MKKDSGTNEERVEFPGYENTTVPPGLGEKTIQSLKNKGMIGSVSSTAMFMRIAVSLLIVAALFYSGWLFGKNDKPKVSEAVSTANTGKEFLLLLYNTPDFVESKAHAKEYGEWMRSIIQNNHIATGEELKKEGWQLSMTDDGFRVDDQPVLTDKGRVSGFFLIKAKDDKRALEIALSCPHIKHKGMIELRPVQSH